MKRVLIFSLCIVNFMFLNAVPVALSKEGAVTDYSKILKKWTRTDKVFRTEDLQAEIIWTATFLNDRVLGAQANAYQETYKVNDVDRDKFLEERKAKQDHQLLFFVSFYAGEKKLKDLKDDSSGWDLRLEAGGRYFRPTHIEKIGKAKPMDIFLFPYLDQWSQGYYVTFSPEAALYTKPWVLSIHGTTARSKLLWK